MKRCGMLVGLGLSLALAGCVVTSVYPYYNNKDLVFEPGLLGSWHESKPDADEKEAWVFEKNGERDYVFSMIEAQKTNQFAAHLFKLKNHLFLDFQPSEPHEDFVPPHYLMRVTQMRPTLKLALLDYSWLAKLVEKEPRAVRHLLVQTEPGKSDKVRVVLTADTQELQKFILKHLDTEGAFQDSVELKPQAAGGHR